MHGSVSPATSICAVIAIPPGGVRRQRILCCRQSEFQGSTWQGLKNRSKHPAQSSGDVARERDGFAFDNQSAAHLLEGPVRIQAPEEAVIGPFSPAPFARRP